MFRPKEPEPMPTIEVGKLIESFDRSRGIVEREHALPGWGLIMRSPYDTRSPSTSWLGGLPHVPPEFFWPRDENEVPEHFIAQIDLASLQPDPITGARPPGLPSQGALLVFFGGLSASLHIINAPQMARAIRQKPPGDTPPLRQSGFRSDATTFPEWQVDPVAYLDTDGKRPIIIRDPFSRARTWIVSSAIAALEAACAIDFLSREIKQIAGSDRELRVLPDARSAAYARLIRDHAGEMLAKLEAWRSEAAAQSPEDPVDGDRLDALFSERLALAQQLETYTSARDLAGNPQALWIRLRQSFPGIETGDFAMAPDAIRPFITAWVRQWRGHRLFGLEPPPANSFENFHGRDCVITVRADSLLGTQTEHEDALSVWCDRDDLNAGRFDRPRLVRHISV